jgi:DNA-binding NtrC family response regulator
MPPLREHLEDLEALVRALLEDLNRKHKRMVRVTDPDALELMRRYSWPGNVRELRNTLERALVACPGNVITSRDLPPFFRGEVEPVVQNQLRIVPGLSVAEVERRHILETLSSTHNNKTKAAAILGITVKTLHNKLKQYAAGRPQKPQLRTGTGDSGQGFGNMKPHVIAWEHSNQRVNKLGPETAHWEDEALP